MSQHIHFHMDQHFLTHSRKYRNNIKGIVLFSFSLGFVFVLFCNWNCYLQITGEPEGQSGEQRSGKGIYKGQSQNWHFHVETMIKDTEWQNARVHNSESVTEHLYLKTMRCSVCISRVDNKVHNKKGTASKLCERTIETINRNQHFLISLWHVPSYRQHTVQFVKWS